jgi:hypothetical protein
MSENLAEQVMRPSCAHLYKRPGNHWKTGRRFDRRETEQEEGLRPLRKTGASRSLKYIIKAKPRRRALWK